MPEGHAELGAAETPVLVEVTRGGMVESRHRGIAAIVDADGHVVAHWGDFEKPVYARSAIKSLQAIPLVESGAADAFGLTPAELALCCASHANRWRMVSHSKVEILSLSPATSGTSSVIRLPIPLR